MAGKPPTPALSPISRVDALDNSRHLVPREVLEAQIADMDRLGTWHLAQALGLAEHMAKYPEDDERWRNGVMDRHLKLAGALLGSINSRVTTFKFLQEGEGDGGEYPGGKREPYARSR